MFDLATKILIVDDMMTMRKLIKKNLTTIGFKNFVEAEDGEKAWALLTEQLDIGLILSDWSMPQCSGLDLLKRVRADDRTKKLPFVMLTAEGELQHVKEAVLAGVDGHVLKPFTADALKYRLGKAYVKRSL